MANGQPKKLSKYLYAIFLTIAFSVLLPHFAMADDFMCPASVTVEEGKTKKPAGWSSYINGPEISEKSASSYFLSRVEFVEYDDMDFLPPSQKINTGNIEQYRWQFTHNNEYDIDCFYETSFIHLTRRLPSGIKNCEVIYQKSESGKLSFNADRCY